MSAYLWPAGCWRLGFFLLAGLLASPVAFANVYACKSASGAVTLQDQPCTAAQQVLRQLESKRALPPPPVARAAAPAVTEPPLGAPVVTREGGVTYITREPSKRTLPLAYTGDMSSPVKRFVVRVYSQRCSDGLEHSDMVRQWSSEQMNQFCTCVGGALYDAQANTDGLKDMVFNHGRGIQAAANGLAPGCVAGPMVPQWMEPNGG